MSAAVTTFPRIGTPALTRDQLLVIRLECISMRIDAITYAISRGWAADLESLGLLASLEVNELATDIMEGKV